MSVERVRVDCAVCGCDVMARPEALRPHPYYPNETPSIHCDDCFFERMGDMLTIHELRRSKLRRPANRRVRDRWIAEYEAAGIDPDQDPGMVTFDVSPPMVGETADEFEGRVVEAAADAWSVRMASPDDFTTRDDG